MKIVKLSIIFFLLIGFSCYQPIIKPTDFDSFWEKSVKSLGTEVKSEIIKDSILGEKRITLNRIESFQGVSIYAWVSEPISKEKYPIYVKFSGFGRGQTDKKSLPYEWFLKQKNNINMVVDIRGQGLSTDQIDFKGYLTNGFEDKDNYIYRGAYLDAVKAIDFIAQNEKSDGNIIAIGGSQGGALSIVASALNKKVTMCLVGFPFLTDIKN